MAQIKLLQGLSTDLGPTSIVDGQLLFTTDTHEIHLDIGTNRVKLYDGLETSLNTLEGLVGNTAVASQIATEIAKLASTYETIANVDSVRTRLTAVEEAIGLGDGDDSGDSLAKKVQANADAIEVLNGSETKEGSVAKTVKDAINEFATTATDNGTIDTFKELVEYVADHGGDAAEMASAITALEGLVGEKSVPTQIDEKIDALDKADTAINGEYVASVSQTDGIITVTRKALPSLDGLEWGSFTSVPSGD